VRCSFFFFPFLSFLSFFSVSGTGRFGISAPACHKGDFDLFAKIWNWWKPEIETQYCGTQSKGLSL
jgi:hypothetical protein